jgi:hypothetical protein
MRTVLVLLGLGAFMLTGCAPSVRVENVTTSHPAVADAEVLLLPTGSGVLTTGADGASGATTDHASSTTAPSASGHDGHRSNEHDQSIYTCPMHPDVSSDEPGRCPKCNMKLVLRDSLEDKR